MSGEVDGEPHAKYEAPNHTRTIGRRMPRVPRSVESRKTYTLIALSSCNEGGEWVELGAQPTVWRGKGRDARNAVEMNQQTIGRTLRWR